MSNLTEAVENTTNNNLKSVNEAERIKKVRSYDIPGSEGVLNSLALLATQIFDVPIALVAIVESNKVIYKGNVGMESITEAAREVSLCSLAILNNDVTVFQNALEEKCLGRNPLVTGNFHLRFYAGAPLKTDDGYNIGTICLVDKKPRIFSSDDCLKLEGLAATAITLIEKHYKKY